MKHKEYLKSVNRNRSLSLPKGQDEIHKNRYFDRLNSRYVYNFKKRTFKIVLSLITISVFFLSCSQPLSSHGITDPQDLLDNYCEKEHRVALGFLYKTPEQTITGVSGITDIETEEPNSRENIFEIGSTTKTFVAVVIMQLVEEGQLTLTDTLDTFGYGFRNAENITVRDLLNHTSGIEDYLDNTSIYNDDSGYIKDWTSDELINLGLDLPGTSGWNYSNTNYVILGQIIESLTGNVPEKEIRNRILIPLEMEHTFYRPNEQVQGTVNHGYFHGDGYWDSWENLNPALFSYAGSMASTMDDLAVFMEALFGGELVSEESLQAMCVMTETRDPFDYGLGLLCLPFEDKLFYGHGGTTFGTRSMTIHCPETGEMYVYYSTLYNDDDFQDLFLDIYRAIK